MRPAERAAGILPAEARRIPPRGTFPRPPAVRAVCRRDARQHAVKTAVRGPQRRGVRVRLPLGVSIPSRRDQCTVTTGRGTCLVPSRGDLCPGRWRVAPRRPARLSGQAAHNMQPSSTGIHQESVGIGGTCCRHLAGRGSPNPAPCDLSAPARRKSRLPAGRTAARCKNRRPRPTATRRPRPSPAGWIHPKSARSTLPDDGPRHLPRTKSG